MTGQPRETGRSDAVVIVGAGPAGLTAARELINAGITPVVLEADNQVGGISRTVEREGWRFDIGGHRFFTKVGRVNAFWREVLEPDEFPTRKRLSRIYYGGKFFAYPIKPLDALRKLGPLEATRCLASYVATRLSPPKDQSDFESWVAARFGWRLYRIFFKTYTEKVWGVPATAIRSDWAAQRIKGLSLPGAVWNAFRTTFAATKHTSLIDRFEYPLLGPGMMWERTADLVRQGGGDLRLGANAVGFIREENGVVAVEVETEREREVIHADHVVSSMPLGELVLAMSPPPPDAVIEAAKGLNHRDFLTVALIVPEANAFPDNWIYVHDPAVKLGRVQNFRSWSPDMVKEGLTCLGLEYFVFEGDELWGMRDEDLVTFATQEIIKTGLVPPGAVQNGFVVRMPRAYPVYDAGYADRVQLIREWLEREVPNVHPVGRNGMHRYNNQDHSMLTAMLATENILGANHDVWEVNLDAEYLESGKHGPKSPPTRSWGGLAGTGRDAPAMIEGGASRPTSSSDFVGTGGWLVRLSRRSPTARRLLRFGFRSTLELRRFLKLTARTFSPAQIGDWRATKRLTWLAYRSAFHLSTVEWLRRVQFRLRDRLTRHHANVPVDHLLVGGWNGLSANRFAEVSGFVLDPSTRLIDSAQVDLLRRYEVLGEALYSDDVLADTPYVARVRAAATISGHHRGARSEAEFLNLAREFLDRFRGLAVPYRPGRTIDSVLPRVRRIANSDCYEIRDGHHRLAIDAAKGVSEVEVAIERPRSTTPAQRLLRTMSWLDGQECLYQPVPLPEVATWPLMRRCDDRLFLMEEFLRAFRFDAPLTDTPSYLDVGACYGWFVAKMQDREFDAYGIESDPLSKQAAQLFYGLDPDRISVGDAVSLLGSPSTCRYAVVSCFSLLHHFVLGRGSCTPERLMSLLDQTTEAILFLDTGEAHESWFKFVLPEWNPQFIRQWILEHSTFTEVHVLGTDQDNAPPFQGKFGRTLFACTR